MEMEIQFKAWRARKQKVGYKDMHLLISVSYGNYIQYYCADARDIHLLLRSSAVILWC